MNLKVKCSTFSKENEGVDRLMELVPRARVHIDFKKFIITVEDFQKDKLSEISTLIRNNFEIETLDLNAEKQFKIMKKEAELLDSKEKLKEKITKKPTSIRSQIQSYILEEKVFSLTDLREKFPDANFGTIRAYVKDMNKNEIITQIERGKYVVR